MSTSTYDSPFADYIVKFSKGLTLRARLDKDYKVGDETETQFGTVTIVRVLED